MTPLRIRNGINLDALQAAPAPPFSSVHIRTEWLGGVQSMSTIHRPRSLNAFGETPVSFAVASDQPPAFLGNDTAPTALELAVAAVAASFAELFVLEASARAVEINALAIEVEANPDCRVGTLAGPVRDLHLLCRVDSGASLPDLRLISRRARDAAPVLQLCRRLPRISIERVGQAVAKGEDM